jgi:hypothetical protein
MTLCRMLQDCESICCGARLSAQRRSLDLPAP